MFHPHDECFVLSGDCFRLGRCLCSCRPAKTRSVDAQLSELFSRVEALESQRATTQEAQG